MQVAGPGVTRVGSKIACYQDWRFNASWTLQCLGRVSFLECNHDELHVRGVLQGRSFLLPSLPERCPLRMLWSREEDPVLLAPLDVEVSGGNECSGRRAGGGVDDSGGSADPRYCFGGAPVAFDFALTSGEE